MKAPSASSQLVRAGFAFEFALVKAEPSRTARQKRHLKEIEAAIAAWLKEHKPRFEAWAVAELRESLGKGEEPRFDVEDLARELTAILTQIVTESATLAASSVGLGFDKPPESALAWARARGAELVGMRWEGGLLVTNPNPRFAITETLREALRAKVTTAIDEGWSPQRLASDIDDLFGRWRAETIARTETGYAYGNGAEAAYREMGVSLVEILDGEGCLPEGHLDGSPEPSRTPGVVEPDSLANGQIWTLDQYQEHVLGHPNCVRGAVPIFSEEVT